MRGRKKGYVVSDETKLKVSQTLKNLGIIPPSRKGCLVPYRKSCGSLSEEHKKNVSLGVKKHYDKKGRITPHRLLLRTSKEYLEFREQVFQRDDYTCQECKDNKGGNLNAHHIIQVCENIDLIFDVDNGITLCEKCHRKIHFKK